MERWSHRVLECRVENVRAQINTVSVRPPNRRSAPVPGAASTKQKTRWYQGKRTCFLNLLRLEQPRSRYGVPLHPKRSSPKTPSLQSFTTPANDAKTSGRRLTVVTL